MCSTPWCSVLGRVPILVAYPPPWGISCNRPPKGDCMGLFQTRPGRDRHGIVSNIAHHKGGCMGLFRRKPPVSMGLFQTSPVARGDCMGLFSNNRPRPFWGIAICPVIRSAPRAAVPAPAPAVRCSFRRGSRPGAIPSALRCRKRACSKGPCIPTGAGPAIGNNPRRAGAANCTPRNRRAERLCA